METIITDLSKLTMPSDKLDFIDDTGIHKDEGLEIIGKLKEIMEADKTILSLAAPQIGIQKRVFCIRFGEQIKIFINPILKKKGKPILSVETNVSLPNKEIAICRPEEIEVTYYNEDFKYEDNKFLGSAAKVFDQMYQLIDGIIPGDVQHVLSEGYEITPADLLSIITAQYSGGGIVVDVETEEDRITSDDQEVLATLLSAYCSTFELVGENLKLSDKPEIRVIYKNLLFQEQIILGKIQVEEDTPAAPKLNREQRRAIDKQVKKHNKKAGK